MERKIACAPHDAAADVAAAMRPDVVIVISSTDALPPALDLGADASRLDVFFDDVEDAEDGWGAPIGATCAAAIARACTMSRRCLVTCSGGVSRSAAVVCAADFARVADTWAGEAFGRNAVGQFCCPNRLVFGLVAEALGADLEGRAAEVEAAFERNVTEHLAASE